MGITSKSCASNVGISFGSHDWKSFIFRIKEEDGVFDRPKLDVINRLWNFRKLYGMVECVSLEMHSRIYFILMWEFSKKQKLFHST